ncbi:peptidylprolyl isomerase [Gelidibacter salicanalis]|uniref:Peptidylprolyl isomerase n=1 Tax=Gelidibacter salicanalis TaxID=291193 RepID=A0A934KSD9_9FLAO|nr:peptidylprolyl isomerase [Gelidibacter salicanalis]MBJ7880541.1 peptidylprolyl isomerase [Gelidibacter salicanalis]
MKIYVSLVLLWLTAFTNAQVSATDVLFTVDGDPIKAEEFIRVYNKNLDLVKDDTQKDIDEYLKLFTNYQLKIKEAKRLGLDKDLSYLKEFSGYKEQLTKSYLPDSKVTEALMKEAYDRMGYDVKASHILIRLEENDTDTLKVYQDLMTLRDRVSDEGFDKVKAEVHDGQQVFAEALGYFSAFKMVYEFENVAYNTKVGSISTPFRTQFGYHIVKVEDKRPSLGEVTVAHIMVNTAENDSIVDAETRINQIYKKIKQGESFESLAKQFSDDKSSAQQGGELAPFTGGQLSAPEFEAVAFGLSTKGEISKPFKTDYGWHIVKLLDKKGMPSYEEATNDIENKIKRDSRSKLISTTLANHLRTTYKVRLNPKAKPYFESILNDNFFSQSWVLPADFDKSQTFVTIQEDTIFYEEFANRLLRIQQVYVGKTIPFKTVIEKEYKGFEEDALLHYHKEHLEFENEEFGYILKEYRDGLLLFDLMEKEVWNAAALDTVGLQTYYSTHKDAYFWDARVDAVIATSAKENDIKKVEELWRKGNTSEEINKELNSNTEQKVIFTEGVLPIDYQGFPPNEVLQMGLSHVYFYNDAYHLVKVKASYPKTHKTFDEAKGKVVSDYQNVLEEQWLKELNSRYKIKLNTEVLQKVKAQISISK